MSDTHFDPSRWENWPIVAVLVVLAVAMIIDASKET